jgi:exonuclease VII small subunit
MSEFEKVMKQLEEILAQIEAINEALKKAQE